MASTWCRRVGVGVPRRGSGRVHPIDGWRRVGISPVRHVGAPAKAGTHGLASGGWQRKDR